MASTEACTDPHVAEIAGSGRVAHLFSDDDVAAVVRAVRAATPFAFRAETLASLIVLLAVTGMRGAKPCAWTAMTSTGTEAVVKVRDSN